MRLFLSALLALLACSSENPLAERVANLEQRLDEVEAAQEEDRLSLLGRLDALAVTADNAEEIGQVRAKLTQTSLTLAEFTALKYRVAALERQIADWSEVVRSLERSVYAVLHNTYSESGPSSNDFYLFVGTAFAVKSGTLVTNGHILEALVERDAWIEAYNRENGTDFLSMWIVVKNLTTNLIYESNYFYVYAYKWHAGWDDDDLNSPDIGLMNIWEGIMRPRAPLATTSEAYQLKVGSPIATLGFPGELQGTNDLADLYPIATFKDGTVSALRPRDEGIGYNAPHDTYIVQHDLDLSGGTGGSPIFDLSGKVVAINNADTDFEVGSISGEPTLVSQAALGFGIRVDKINEFLDNAGVAAKRTTHAGPSRLASRLDGRDIRSLDIVTTREEFVERLAEMR